MYSCSSKDLVESTFTLNIGRYNDNVRRIVDKLTKKELENSTKLGILVQKSSFVDFHVEIGCISRAMHENNKIFCNEVKQSNYNLGKIAALYIRHINLFKQYVRFSLETGQPEFRKKCLTIADGKAFLRTAEEISVEILLFHLRHLKELKHTCNYNQSDITAFDEVIKLFNELIKMCEF